MKSFSFHFVRYFKTCTHAIFTGSAFKLNFYKNLKNQFETSPYPYEIAIHSKKMTMVSKIPDAEK